MTFNERLLGKARDRTVGRNHGSDPGRDKAFFCKSNCDKGIINFGTRTAKHPK